MIYILIVLLLLFLSFRYDICGKTEYRLFCYNVVLIILILVAGFRWRLGTDSLGALEKFYVWTPSLNEIRVEGSFLRYPGWAILNSAIFTVGGKFYHIQLIQSLVLNYLLFNYFKKHCRYIFTCVLIYYLWLYSSFNMEELKACMALPFCLYANDYLLGKKWLKGYSLLIVGWLFHFSVLVLFFVPLLYSFLRLNKKGVLLLLCMFGGGFLIQKFMGDYLLLFELSDEFNDKIDVYANSDKYSMGMTPLKTLFLLFPIIIYSLFSGYYIKKQEMEISLNNLEPCMMTAMVFLILQVNVFLFYRFFHFYAVYCILYISQASVNIVRNTKSLSISLSYVRTIVFLIPFVICIILPYRNKYYRYYPYYSIFERKIDKTRESKQSEYHPDRVVVRYDWY